MYLEAAALRLSSGVSIYMRYLGRRSRVPAGRWPGAKLMPKATDQAPFSRACRDFEAASTRGGALECLTWEGLTQTRNWLRLAPFFHVPRERASPHPLYTRCGQSPRAGFRIAVYPWRGDQQGYQPASVTD
jgi:hypothetical protein